MGAKYASEVAAILHRLGCEVSITDAVALASMAPDGGQCEPVKGWDAANAVARVAGHRGASPGDSRAREAI